MQTNPLHHSAQFRTDAFRDYAHLAVDQGYALVFMENISAYAVIDAFTMRVVECASSFRDVANTIVGGVSEKADDRVSPSDDWIQSVHEFANRFGYTLFSLAGEFRLDSIFGGESSPTGDLSSAERWLVAHIADGTLKAIDKESLRAMGWVDPASPQTDS